MKRATTANRQAESSIERQTVERDVEHEDLDVSTVTEQASDEEVITVEREYDTSKPVDSITGTPPLKREIMQTRRDVDTGRREQTIEQNTDRQHDVTEQVVTQSRDDVVVEATEKRGMNVIQKALCAIGALAVLAGIAWLIWKLKRLF